MSARRGLSYKKYLLFGAAIVFTLSLPAFLTEGLRAKSLALFSPFWRGANHLLVKKQNADQGRIEAENHLLRMEIGRLKAFVEQRSAVDAMAKELLSKELPGRRQEELEYLNKLQAQAAIARVIYRDPTNWSSTLWINAGEETNKRIGKPIIQKNSPVLLGRGIVGAVDYVGKKQSRIRLITDAGLKPSVRAIRGSPQKALLVEHIDPLLRQLNVLGDLPLSQEERQNLVQRLEKIKESASADYEQWHLAKGILQGGSSPIWRSVNQTLRGIGFNYDFPDDEGPARDLRTGTAQDDDPAFPSVPIIQVGDLLVTTGMDGIFPPGLRAAEVTKVMPLKEGAYTYEIEAIPSAGPLDSLHTVFVIPPIGYDIEEQPKKTLYDD